MRRFHGSIVPDALMRLQSLGPGPKLLLARLYKFAGIEETCYPGLDLLAGELGANRDTICAWMGMLEDAGFIRTIRRQRKEALRALLLARELVPSLTDFEIGRIQNQELRSEIGRIKNQGAILKAEKTPLDGGKNPVLKSEKQAGPYKERARRNHGSESRSESERESESERDPRSTARERAELNHARSSLPRSQTDRKLTKQQQERRWIELRKLFPPGETFGSKGVFMTRVKDLGHWRSILAAAEQAAENGTYISDFIRAWRDLHFGAPRRR
jgi:hypothetical protein